MPIYDEDGDELSDAEIDEIMNEMNERIVPDRHTLSVPAMLMDSAARARQAQGEPPMSDDVYDSDGHPLSDDELRDVVATRQQLAAAGHRPGSLAVTLDSPEQRRIEDAYGRFATRLSEAWRPPNPDRWEGSGTLSADQWRARYVNRLSNAWKNP